METLDFILVCSFYFVMSNNWSWRRITVLLLRGQLVRWRDEKTDKTAKLFFTRARTLTLRGSMQREKKITSAFRYYVALSIFMSRLSGVFRCLTTITRFYIFINESRCMEAASGPSESNLVVIRSARMIIITVIFRGYIIFYKSYP